MGENILKLIRAADVITLLNAFLGFASVVMTVRGQVDDALMLVLLAVITDGADGAIARRSGYGVLGANLDSLADVVSFGVAPAAAAFAFLGSFAALVFTGFFLLCGVLRLARFNVMGKKDSFEGIPITAGGFVVALFVLVRSYIPYFEYASILLLILLAVLMVSTVVYPKVKNPARLAPVGVLLVADILLFYLGYHGTVRLVSLVLFILAIIYILSPLGGRFIRQKKQQSET